MPAGPAAALAALTLIVNANVLDGTGAPSRKVAVRLDAEAGRIVEVGDLKPGAGETVIDAQGMTLAPGFIDTHSHGDDELFEHPDALADVSQGITTIVVGQDGSMTWPVRAQRGTCSLCYFTSTSRPCASRSATTFLRATKRSRPR